MVAEISIIVPCYNEVEFIENMVSSVANQTLPVDRFELLIIDGLSDDGTSEKLKELAEEYVFLRVLTNEHRFVSSALNIGIANSIGDFVCRMDVHAIYPNNYLEVLLELSVRTGADNVGCVLETLPGRDTLIANSIAKVLSSPFGVGSALFRTGAKSDRSVDTVPFGFFKREVFRKIGGFDVDLIRNQDDELNGRIIKHGGKIVLTSSIKVKYYSRDTFKKLSKMYYQYGLYKPFVNKKLGSPATLRQFFPLFLFLYSTIGFAAFLILINLPLFSMLYGIGILVYFMLAILFSFRIPFNQGFAKKSSCVFAFVVLHLSYGCGYFNGLVHQVFDFPISKVEVNR